VILRTWLRPDPACSRMTFRLRRTCRAWSSGAAEGDSKVPGRNPWTQETDTMPLGTGAGGKKGNGVVRPAEGAGRTALEARTGERRRLKAREGGRRAAGLPFWVSRN